MRALLIYNPAAGSNRRDPRFRRQLAQFAATHAEAVVLSPTTHPGHATTLARRAAAEGFSCVAAIGGDGTANEVAQGLLDTSTSLALVPRGSGNGLARHLGIPLRPDAALALILQPAARVRRIDTGLAAGRVFINVMGSGLDALISRRFAASARRGLGTYLRLTLGALRELQPDRCTIITPREEVTLDTVLLAVANSPQYGNGAEVAPGASVDDGQLDLVAVRRMGALAGLGLAPRLWCGNFDRHPRVLRRAGESFLLRRSRPGDIHTDGEPHFAPAEIPVEIRPRSLGVLLPPPHTSRP